MLKAICKVSCGKVYTGKYDSTTVLYLCTCVRYSVTFCDILIFLGLKLYINRPFSDVTLLMPCNAYVPTSGWGVIVLFHMNNDFLKCSTVMHVLSM